MLIVVNKWKNENKDHKRRKNKRERCQRKTRNLLHGTQIHVYFLARHQWNLLLLVSETEIVTAICQICTHILTSHISTKSVDFCHRNYDHNMSNLQPHSHLFVYFLYFSNIKLLVQNTHSLITDIFQTYVYTHNSSRQLGKTFYDFKKHNSQGNKNGSARG